jgi:hypothetical protein
MDAPPGRSFTDPRMLFDASLFDNMTDEEIAYFNDEKHWVVLGHALTAPLERMDAQVLLPGGFTGNTGGTGVHEFGGEVLAVGGDAVFLFEEPTTNQPQKGAIMARSPEAEAHYKAYQKQYHADRNNRARFFGYLSLC